MLLAFTLRPFLSIQISLWNWLAVCVSLLLARAVPPLRPVSDPVAFDMPAGASLADQARAILTGVAAGRIDPIIGKALVDAVAAVANVAALDEIERRLSALEDGGSKDVR